MRLLLLGLCLFSLTACQGGSGGSSSGGAPENRENRLTLKTKEDRDFLALLRIHGSRDRVAREMMFRLLKHTRSSGYKGVSERDVEETLNNIHIICEGNECETEQVK